MTNSIRSVLRSIPLLRKLWRSGLAWKTRNFWQYETRNQELKDRHLGKRAFVIGNGPSILKQDLPRLNGEVTFVMNSFFLHSQFHAINPTYLCSCDSDILNADYRKAWYRLHQQVDTRRTTMLFAKGAQKLDRQYGLFREHRVYYLLIGTGILPPLSNLTYCPTDLTRPLASHGLVFLDIALLAAFYMGIQTVYLIGFDAGPIRSFDDYVNYNFYGQDPLMSIDKLRKDYEFFFVQKEYNESRSDLYERSVECVRRTFARRGVDILNATLDGGHLDGFPHVNFEDVLADRSNHGNGMAASATSV